MRIIFFASFTDSAFIKHDYMVRENYGNERTAFTKEVIHD
jgi:hypothetical protein